DRVLVTHPRSLREELNAGPDLRFPHAHRSRRTLEDLLTATETPLVGVVAISGRELRVSCSSHLAVRRRSRSRLRKHLLELGRRRPAKPHAHARLSFARIAAQPLLPSSRRDTKKIATLPATIPSTPAT